MTRELTLRTSGMIFYLVLASILLASRAGAESLSCLFSQSGVTDVYQVVMAAVAASVAVFTSDAMGFLVSTIALFLWNRCTKLKLWWSIESGYSLDWEEHLGFNWRDHIVRRYNEKIGVEDSLDPKHGPPGAQWKAYGNDVFVSYFWELAPDRIGEWATRRYSAFQAHRSAITAIILGLVIGAACVGSMRLGCTALPTGLSSWYQQLWRQCSARVQIAP